MNSTFGKTFLFLTNLAWKSRVTLPVIITAGFMVLNFRWEVEINIHTERIAIQGADGRGGGGGGGANRVAGVAAIDYSLEESWESTDEDEEEEEDDNDEYDEDDETDYEYDEASDDELNNDARCFFEMTL